MAPSAFEEPHYVYPAAEHTHTIIALHGRGSQGQEFSEELFENKTSSGQSVKDALPGYKWVFPSSQERYSTVFQEELDEWFDIYSLTDPAAREELQVEGLRDSTKFLQGILQREIEIIGSERVIMLGLSQGCATALLTFLASEAEIGAFIGLNGWMPFAARIEDCNGRLESLATTLNTTLGIETRLAGVRGQEVMLTTPILLLHTADDEVVDIFLGRQARDILKNLGLKVEWQEVKEGGHLGMLETQGLDHVVDFVCKAA